MSATRSPVFSPAALFYITPCSQGRPIIVFIAAHLPPKADLDYERLLLYLIKTLDARVNGPYTLVYIHSNMRNRPSSSWLSEVYSIFNRK